MGWRPGRGESKMGRGIELQMFINIKIKSPVVSCGRTGVRNTKEYLYESDSVKCGHFQWIWRRQNSFYDLFTRMVHPWPDATPLTIEIHFAITS